MRCQIAISIFTFSASVFSAPTPQLGLDKVLGGVTGTAGGLVGGVTGTVGSVTGDATKEADLDGITGILQKEKRGIIGGLTRPIGGLVGDVTKTRVVGNARRQLNLPLVGGATNIVDGITGKLNTNGAVDVVNTNLHNKRGLLGLDSDNDSDDILGDVVDTDNLLDLNIDVKRGLLGLDSDNDSDNILDDVVDTDNLLNLDINVKRGLLGLDSDNDSDNILDNVIDTDNLLDLDIDVKRGLLGLDNANDSDNILDDVVDTDNLLDLDIDIKRGIPVFQDLPVAGGLVNTIEGVTGDLHPVSDTVFDAVEPATDATSILDARAPLIPELESTVGSVETALGSIAGNGNPKDNSAGNGSANGNGNGNGNGNSILSDNSLVNELNL